MTDTQNSIGGIAVITREPATGPNPLSPERTVAFATVDKVLLANEQVVYQCNTCYDFVSSEIQPVTAHQRKHSAKTRVAREQRQRTEAARRGGIASGKARAAKAAIPAQRTPNGTSSVTVAGIVDVLRRLADEVAALPVADAQTIDDAEQWRKLKGMMRG